MPSEKSEEMEKRGVVMTEEEKTASEKAGREVKAATKKPEKTPVDKKKEK